MQPEKSVARRHPLHQTQWAAQFAVSSELCRRGYQVALTLGNHPSVDIMVLSPQGRQFNIDVKGLHKPNYWIIRRRDLVKDLYYVLAYVPAPPLSNEFFVLSHEEVIAAQKKDIAKSQIRRPEIDDTYPVQGVPWGASKAFKERWDALPA